jgi:hypothetical protein
MSDLQNAIFPIRDQDVVRNTSRVRQLVDILQVDIASVSGSAAQSPSTDTKTRKRHEVFVTGGLDANTSAVTSSLFQTVFDQDYETQTANELLDVTVGCFSGSTAVSNALDLTKGLEDENGNLTGIDAYGKKIFKNNVLMMREKINIYKQYAQYLLGDAENYFTSPYESSFTDVESGTESLSYDERIDEALFINIKRLFTRDAIVKDEFVIKLFEHAHNTASGSNVAIDTNDTTALLISDSGSSTALRVTGAGGSIGTLKRSGSTGDDGNVGLIFYEKGVIVLDAKKIFDADQNISGSISSVADNNDASTVDDTFDISTGTLEFSGSFIPNFWVSGSIDDIVDHVCSTRFGRTNATATGFLNHTFINSSVYICRVAPSQANYSRNPSYRKGDGTLRFIEDTDDLGGSNPFSYITTVGLYDSNNNLLAVAKTSRPIEKNTETDLSVSVRIDY